MTTADLVADILLECGAIAAGETAPDVDTQFVLGKLNRLLDNWNAERAATYADAFNSYVLTASLQPHLIGPTGSVGFTSVTQRPVSIEGANIVQGTGTTAYRWPVSIRDKEWWLNQRVQGMTSVYPTDLYYEPDWPNGKLFLWPVPTTAYSLELLTRFILAATILTDTFTMPPGYRDAITLSVAEESCEGLSVPIPGTLPARALKARARIFANNDEPPRIQTRDAGMPGAGAGGFNYMTGLMNGPRR